MAVNCWVSPLAIDGFAGVTAMETSVAAVTVRTAELLVTPADVAVMFEAPTERALAWPEEVIVATAGVAELQLSVLVRF